MNGKDGWIVRAGVRNLRGTSKKQKHLKLGRESVRVLGSAELAAIAGGATMVTKGTICGPC